MMILLMPLLAEGVALLSALLALSMIRSVGAGLQTPAVNATVPLLVPDEKRMRFNGMNAAVPVCGAVRRSGRGGRGAHLWYLALHPLD